MNESNGIAGGRNYISKNVVAERYESKSIELEMKKEK